ncbi:chemotaxis-specific protein-glutamate methyltransferase CheB [Geobacter sp. DSM 9736]|uniref:chemotaxis-specific protein-glutamate methyltransferase CheB n=1 Tax=Geobacter sp. DSM 9736 TaxID=1277350 RepID=UPI000B5111C8|nr:chemotaxis-specific protein-glutamate methyltransferase CheB [Geobacter sp. DSM 9736]SNB47685.1 two-component system, chemotaxis family, response regulator CheB [Geobacter sp. DSM 9736]
MIKVLLADDSNLARTILRDIFHRTSDIAVVGEAADGREAVDKSRLLKPDLVIMDILMPVMDGMAAIEEIMATSPVPILVLSSTMEDREVHSAFAAIKKGALDVMGKPGGADFILTEDFQARLVEKVRLLARIRVIHHLNRAFVEPVPAPVPPQDAAPTILAVGASTGGPRAVLSILKALPADFPGAVYIVQHIAQGFARGFAKWLDTESSISVRLAEDGEGVSPGEAVVAPNDCHMIMENGHIKLIDAPPVNCCRPSIDVLFNALAEDQGARVLGVLLTGMGKDGALGLRRIRECGGATLVQDEETSVVFGMPRAAISLNAAGQVLPLSGIPHAILRLFGKNDQFRMQ